MIKNTKWRCSASTVKLQSLGESNPRGTEAILVALGWLNTLKWLLMLVFLYLSPICEKLKAPIMRSLYKRSRWPHADVPQWPLVFPPPFISVCTIYCVYEAALIWYFITEESDKNTPADSENVQNPLYNLIHPFNIHHFYKFLLLKNTALYPHFF